MPDTFTDSSGNRVLIRYEGPPGVGIPAGGTEGQILRKLSNTPFATQWVNAPDGTGAVTFSGTLPADGEIVIFDGITGGEVKASGRLLSYYAPASALADKVDKVVGKVLSANDFTNILKTKLDAIQSTAGFRGVFDSMLEADPGINSVEANDFIPNPVAGDFCLIASSGQPIGLVLWDSVNLAWELIVTPTALSGVTGQDLADLLFDADDAAAWDVATCRIFTEEEKGQLATHETLLQTLGASVGVVTPAVGALGFFSLTGTTVPITAVSDGLTNMIVCNVVSELSAISSSFDDGGASSGRLRYRGSVTRSFQVSARVAVGGVTSGTLVVGIAKSGSLDQSSRTVIVTDAAGASQNVLISSIMSLSPNDYVEVAVGNTTDNTDPTVRSLSIEAVSI